MEFRGSPKLTLFVCSPIASCPSLRHVDLSHCDQLKCALIQSESLESLDFSMCIKLNKMLLQCKNLKSLTLEKCESVKTLMIWSDALEELDLSACQGVSKLELYCPALTEAKVKMPIATPEESPPEVKYMPVAKLVLENMNARQEMKGKLGASVS